jgi:hypothetical protein
VDENETVEGVDKSQIEKLKRRQNMFQADSEEEKWKLVYLILFPDTALSALPSPCKSASACDYQLLRD